MGVVATSTDVLTQVPKFSSQIDAVRVDVLVTDRGQVVRGLEAADFEVRDNGVTQRVDVVTFERLPLTVVLALDVSDSVDSDRLAHLREARSSVLDHLTAEDEAALVTFTHIVKLDSALTNDHALVRRALERAHGFGRTSLVDASYASIILAESGLGRSLVILFSDGVDTSSWLSEDAVLNIARRSDVVVYCVFTGGVRNAAFAEELTSLTGGSLLRIGSTADLRATFLRVLQEFQQRYVLTYTPRGVPDHGWHRLQVRVKGRRATVRARPGYLAGS